MDEAAAPQPSSNTKIACKILLLLALIAAITCALVFLAYLIRRGTYKERAVTIINELNETAHVECALNESKIRSMADLEPNGTLEFWFEQNIMEEVYAWCYANCKDTFHRKFDVWGKEAPEEHARVYTLFDDGIYLKDKLVYRWNPFPGSTVNKKKDVVILRKA